MPPSTIERWARSRPVGLASMFCGKEPLTALMLVGEAIRGGGRSGSPRGPRPPPIIARRALSPLRSPALTPGLQAALA